MKPLTIRARFFFGLLILLILFIGLQTTIFVAYEIHEWQIDYHRNLDEEVEEVLVLLGVDAVMIPVLLMVMWYLSKRMLRPLNAIARTAQRISSGQLDERIRTRNPQDELGMLAGTINQAFDRYRDAVERLRRFSSDASHQLRTPLAAIRSTGEVAMQKNRAPEEYRQTLESILEEVQHLSHIVEQLLMLARLESPRIRAGFTRVCCSDLVSSVFALYEPLAQDKKIKLELQIAPALFVKGDASLLEQVMANLLDNALKFVPEHGSVRVGLAKEHGNLIFSVSDSGPGIPEQYRTRIFERFARVPRAGPEGSGLGLAIVADIVQVHEGRVEVESRLAEGAVFRVCLPAAD